MAQGDVLLNSTGNVTLDDAGNVMLSDAAGDPCCCGPNDCRACVGLNGSFRVSFDGVLPCAGAANPPWSPDGELSLDTFQWLTPPNLGTYDLPFVGITIAAAGPTSAEIEEHAHSGFGSYVLRLPGPDDTAVYGDARDSVIVCTYQYVGNLNAVFRPVDPDFEGRYTEYVVDTLIVRLEIIRYRTDPTNSLSGYTTAINNLFAITGWSGTYYLHTGGPVIPNRGTYTTEHASLPSPFYVAAMPRATGLLFRPGGLDWRIDCSQSSFSFPNVITDTPSVPDCNVTDGYVSGLAYGGTADLFRMP